MKDKFGEFIEQCKKSKELDPWARQTTAREYADQMIKEVEEVILEIENNDHEKLTDELGDVLIDWAHTCISARVDNKEAMQCSIDKFKRRKPFLAKNRTVLLEEAKQIWKKAKAEEKND